MRWGRVVETPTMAPRVKKIWFAGKVAAAAVALALVASPVHAQSSSSARARVLFAEARKLMDSGRFDEACPKLEESLKLDQGIGTQFNLAHCWEKTGRTASAWGLFLDVASAAGAAGQAKREAAARQRADALKPKLMRLSIEVTHLAPGLEISLSGESIGRPAWGTPMPVDPGIHRIEATAPGRLPWSQEVTLDAPGQTVAVTIPELESEARADEPAIVQAPAPESTTALGSDEGTERGLSTGRIVTGAVLGAVGVGGLVVGTVFGLEASSETKAAQALCVGEPTGTVCDRDRNLPNFDGGAQERAELEEHRENSDRAALISYIGWGVGAAGLIASAVVLLTGSDQEASAEDSAGLQLEPVVGASAFGAALRGSF